MRPRIWLYMLIALLLIPLAGGTYLYWQAKRAEPTYAGSVRLGGLADAVSVHFSRHAVPYVNAGSVADLLFAQGYLVASERMWQMDLMRRLAAGTVAEIFGAEAERTDRLFRTLGLARAAKRNLAALDNASRGHLAAYARGVNAYLEEAADRAPLEYRLTRLTPAPWKPLDSLVIAEYMGYLLSFNVREELAYLRLAARLGPQRVLELFPTDEGIPAPAYARTLPDYALRLRDALDGNDALATRWGLPRPGAASNGWAVDGDRTRGRRPLLANDPHLSPTMPALWYELEMQAPGYHVSGIALPGLPLIVIGHNDHLAWGFTTTMADTQDLFVERVNEVGTAVQRPQGAWEAIATDTETIAVKGRQAPVRLTVRHTSHGVILNDILGGHRGTPTHLTPVDTPYLLALRWNIELPDRALQGLYRLNTATTIADAQAAVRQLTHVAQNVLLVHRDGTIGWQMSGALPLRTKGLGTFPSPGWSGEYGWSGYVPGSENPSDVNPAEGLLITANNRILPLDHPVHVTCSWMAPYRAIRIRELLEDSPPLSVEDLAKMQLDWESVQARRLLTSLENVAVELRQVDPYAWVIARDHLLTWDGQFDPDSAPAALFALLPQALFTALFADELQGDLEALLSVSLMSYNALEAALYRNESSFWDDVGTAAVEGPAHIWARAIRSAWSALEQAQAKPAQARLDRLRRLVFPHAFHRVFLLGSLFDVGPIGVGGDSHTVNAMKALPSSPEDPLFIPSYRVVFSPGDWRATRGTQPLGQSGHRFSAHRTDQLQDWLAGRTHRWSWGGPDPEQRLGTLMLLPAHVPTEPPPRTDVHRAAGPQALHHALERLDRSGETTSTNVFQGTVDVPRRRAGHDGLQDDT